MRKDRIQVPEFEELRELSWQAIESGLESDEVESYLQTMGFDTAAYEPLASRLHGPYQLSDSEARTRRLQQADRLQADVRDLTEDESEYSMFPA